MPAKLTVCRHFTAQNPDPYAGIIWKTFTSAIKNPDGSPVFSADSLEFPDTWEQNAVDIVAAKYLRKAGVPIFDSWGSPVVDPETGIQVTGAENSMRQIADRLAGAWTVWGQRAGLFATETDAENYRDEIRYMLIRQMAAPNSPQWFNTGLYEAYGLEEDAEGNFYYDPDAGEVRLSEHKYQRSAASACFPSGTRVMTQEGMRGIEKIVPGDMVLTHKARFRPVVELMQKNSSELITVKVDGVTSGPIRATPEHPFLTLRDGLTREKPVWVNAVDLKADDYVVVAGSELPDGVLSETEDNRTDGGLGDKIKDARRITSVTRETVTVPVYNIQVEEDETYTVEGVVVHNCYILRVDDTLVGDFSIMRHVEDCARLFKGGSGVGANYSNLREEGGSLTGGGVSSGLLSWIRVHDRAAGAIKSGGTCLAPHQFVYTADRGPVPVKELADDGGEFLAISYDPPAGRYKIKKANAWHAGTKQLVRVRTDKGTFELTFDHPVRTTTHETILAGDLKEGTSLLACTIDTQHDHLQIGLRDGNKGKEFIHRMILEDVHDVEAADRVRYHDDENKLNNRAENLIPLTPCEEMAQETETDDHKVVSVEVLEESDVYDVEVDCPTADNKTPESGHNFVIWEGDKATGSGIVVYNTRRAARMVIVDADHPDIEKYIWSKVKEEKKVQALIAAGYDSDYNGEAYDTVSFQNANHSVRIPAGFLDAVKHDRMWDLTGRKDGKVVKSMRARDLWEQIADAAWQSGDPGLQFDDLINDWNTVADTERVVGTNPCFPADARVHTNKGLVRIEELFKRLSGGEDIKVWTHNCTTPGTPEETVSLSTPTEIAITGVNDIVRLLFSNGAELRCTPGHKIWTHNRGYVEAVQLKTSDQVRVADLRHEINAKDTSFYTTGRTEVLPDTVVQSYASSQGHTTVIPAKWDKDFMRMLGWLVGDESMNDFSDTSYETRECKVSWMHGSTEEQESILPKHASELSTILGLDINMSNKQNDAAQMVGTRRTLIDVLFNLGFLAAEADKERIPEAIFHADQKTIRYFLQGLFDSGGTVIDDSDGARYVGLASVSSQLLRDVQKLLTTFGINARIYTPTNKAGKKADFAYTTHGDEEREHYGKPCGSLRISTGDIAVFADEIGFGLASKNERLQSLLAGQSHGSCSTNTHVSLVNISKEPPELTYNLNEPRNHSYIVDGIVVRNCSEFTHVNNTSCNLASINVLKFWDNATTTFDIEAFEHACRLWTVTLEITVEMSHYPTEAVAKKSYEHRPLGLGLMNIGAMLMQSGIAYDSQTGCAVLAACTGLMHNIAYATSAEMAKAVGPFDAYTANKNSMQRVLRNHRRAAYGTLLRARPEIGEYEELTVNPEGINHLALSHTRFGALTERTVLAADRAVELAEKYGVRNAQVSLYAPTGTIALATGCDTTGIEPDFSLIKMKKLAGGGYMHIVNQSVRPGLETLGYDAEVIDDIINWVIGTRTLNGNTDINEETLRECGFGPLDIQAVEQELKSVGQLSWAFGQHIVGEDLYKKYGVKVEDGGYVLLKALGFKDTQIRDSHREICGTGTVEGAPGIKDSDIAVFDCAVEAATGSRSISWEGHVRALAAVAPHLSGSVSKTTNLPADATIEDIKDAHEMAYRNGVKCIAVYRDGSKFSQPLNAGDEEGNDAEEALAISITEMKSGMSPTEFYLNRPVHEFELPNMVSGKRWRFDIGGETIYLRSGEYADGTCGEIFLDWGKPGSTLRGITAALSITFSQALQHGMPLRKAIKSLRGLSFAPNGMVTRHDELRMADSIIDAVVRTLGYHYLNDETLVQVPKKTESSTLETAEGTTVSLPEDKSEADMPGEQIYGKTCSNCGSSDLMKSGTCETCRECGTTTGCA